MTVPIYQNDRSIEKNFNFSKMTVPEERKWPFQYTKMTVLMTKLTVLMSELKWPFLILKMTVLINQNDRSYEIHKTFLNDRSNIPKWPFLYTKIGVCRGGCPGWRKKYENKKYRLFNVYTKYKIGRQIIKNQNKFRLNFDGNEFLGSETFAN